MHQHSPNIPIHGYHRTLHSSHPARYHRHQLSPVDQIEVELGILLILLSIGVQMSRFLGGQTLAVVSLQRDGAVMVPHQVEQGVR